LGLIGERDCPAPCCSDNGESIDRDTRTTDQGRIWITGFTAFTAFDLRQWSESQPFPPGARNGRRTVLTGFMIGPMKAGWTASSSMAGNDIHLGRLAGDECRCLVGHGDGSG
jgi:hypothetical protein